MEPKIKRFPEKGIVGERSKGPVIIGMPGFVGALEGGRIEDILSDLSEEGFVNYGLVFSDIEMDGNKVTCHVNFRNYLRDVDKTIKRVLSDPFVDPSRLAFLASSIGGAVFGHWAPRQNREEGSGVDIKRYASVSPIPGWSQYRTPEIRAYAETLPEIRITSPLDEERGIERVIPNSSLPEVKKFDAIKELRENYASDGMSVLTLFGRHDDIISGVEAIREYHEALGGNPRDRNELVGYDCGHAIPNDLSKERIKAFFRKMKLS